MTAALVAVVAVRASDAAAQAWGAAYPGVRYLAETRPGPVRVRAVEVDLCAPGVSLRATRSGESGRRTSSFGSLVGAEVAVNGDFFSRGYTPTGLAVGAGEHWSDDQRGHGFVAFGEQMAQISAPGTRVASPPAWMSEAVGGNIMVLTDGAPTRDSGTFCTTRHPRTAAGLSADGTKLYLAVADGRSGSSIGMTCTELGQLMGYLGAHNALNLDGGGSTTMWRRGVGVVNVPSDGSQRTVSNHLAVQADGEGPATSCPRYDIEVDTAFLGLDVVHADGNGEMFPDVFPGDRFEAEILVSNQSPGIIRNVWAGYWFEHPYLEAVDYTIYTDHPEYDRKSWVVNDANEAPENPPGNEMGQEGALNLYAFSPGETKRILVEMEATQYSIGQADHPDIRGWVRNIDNVYGVQEGFRDDPELNRVGENLRAFSQLDVLSRDHWHFASPLEDLFEGWRRCEGGVDAMRIDTDAHALVAEGEGEPPCVRSPEWTRIDAERFDELVVVGVDGVEAGEWHVAWEGDGAGEVSFELPEPGAEAAVFALGEEPTWSGEVGSLRLRLESGDVLAAGAVWLQSSAEGQTSSPYAEYVDAARAVRTGGTSGGGDGGSAGEDGGVATGDGGRPGPGSGGGCRATGGPVPAGSGPIAWAVVAGLVVVRRRRARRP